jgi:uncharacterized OB-fold protein
VSELEIQLCDACGVALFPDRLRCPRCGEQPAKRVPAGPGRVEQQTEVRRPRDQTVGPVRLASVRLDAGPVVIARLAERTDPETVVRLEVTPDGAIWGRSTERGEG